MQRIGILSLFLVASIALSAHGQTGDKAKDNKQVGKGVDMRVPFTPLWTGDAPGAKGKDADDIPGVYIYRAKNPNGAAVVICPGGGYARQAMDHEGVQVADWLNKHGVTAVVLKYRVGPKYNYPYPFWDAVRAIRYARAKAVDLKVDPRRVGVIGFSAGGHLASTLAVHCAGPNPGAQDPIDQLSCTPDFAVLLYPVITLSGPFAHVGSRNNLLGKNADPKMVEFLSTHKQVNAKIPPTFLVHTKEDKSVPVENSQMFYDALTTHKVPAQIRIYEKGRHGLGLALKEGDRDLPYAQWPEHCIAWMKGRGILADGK